VAILIELLLCLSALPVLLVTSKDFMLRASAAVSLAICGYLTVGCIRALKRGFKGDPARLRATTDEGLRVWAGTSERPQIALPRNLITDVRVETDPWAWWHRSWRLVIVVDRGLRRRRRLFSSIDLGGLVRICAALRRGLGLDDTAQVTGEIKGDIPD
jgi:hypothetical protein